MKVLLIKHLKSARVEKLSKQCPAELSLKCIPENAIENFTSIIEVYSYQIQIKRTYSLCCIRSIKLKDKIVLIN